ncbi:hypothetical protein [Roseisolibacter sp. H3M3-2]|uniref:hypothetical protein n=1 Tax=Roseisolibacter sp. H3M3-2 TaxID=3031323 RepID=UPI0023DC200D|nr:hypothetical protein [Roseisolibacter sp. H3M3-2]MDF1505099.1 hypothetical protein [Roseisolibacter sp. H3M3-2]
MTSPTGRRLVGASRTLLGLASALVVAAAPGDAIAQQPAPRGPAPSWLRARPDGRFDATSRVAVERLVDSAHAAGLPAEPLVDKALEGASKRAPREAILKALRTMAADLAVARQALGGQSLADELTAGAVALRGGIEEDALRILRRERPGQPLVVALGVLTDLVARGVPANDASRAVLGLTRAGIADEQLVAFRRDVERDIGIGAPPAAAATIRATTLGVSAQRDGGLPGAASRTPSTRPKP